MNSYPNPLLGIGKAWTGEDIKIWFCSRRLADLIIKKVNRQEWHRIYFSLDLKPWDDYRVTSVGLDGMIVMVKEEE